MKLDPDAGDEIRRFEEQFRQNPDSLVFARLADAYRKVGDTARALELLDAGIVRHADYPSAHIVRARVLTDLGRVADAVMSFQKVLDLDGQNLVALRGLADISLSRGDAVEARHWFELLTQVDPLNQEAIERLRALERELGGVPTAGPSGGGSDEDLAGPLGESASDGILPGALAGPGREAHEGPAAGAEPQAGAEPGAEASDSGADVAAEGREPTARDGRNGDGEGGESPDWWYEDRSPEQDVEDGADADLLTRTMADLYARQGLYEEALEIYAELLRDRPGDEELEHAEAALREEAAKSRSSRRETPRDSRLPGKSFPERGDAWLEDRTATADAPAESLAAELHSLLRAGEALATAEPDLPDERSRPERPRPAQARDEEADTEIPGRRSGTGPVVQEWLRRLRS